MAIVLALALGSLAGAAIITALWLDARNAKRRYANVTIVIRADASQARLSLEDAYAALLLIRTKGW